ncbi:MAG: SulP family inorganic anion transporter [Thermodesulfobacteriota bacterium]
MISRLFPFVKWFRNYGVDDLKADALSGLTVALVLVPQSMAYADLAGLPAYYGLYASLVPPMVAALFGSSRQLATGPVAVVSLMTSSSLAPLAMAGTEGYISYAILLALMVGVFQFALAVLRLGVVVNFLSHPVVNGFTNAAALIIATSQLSKMFGVNVDNAEHHYETVARVVQAAIHYTHWPTFLMGALAFLLMYALRWISPRIPNVLIAVALSTVVSWATGFERNTTVKLDSIESEQVQGMVRDYRRIQEQIGELARERTIVQQALDEASDGHDIIALVNTEHAMSVLTLNIEQLKERLHARKAEIRRVVLRRVILPNGGYRFCREGKVPEGSVDDGRAWRIRVGNRPINEESILMMGGGAVVGAIPVGLPSLAIPKVDFRVLGRLFPYAVIISLLGFMEAISIAKAMAAKTGQRLDPNQELVGQGLANMCGAVACSYPTSGSFSRSAVNLQAGAISGLSSVFTSLAVVVVLLFFTPFLYHLPESVLAAIIMIAVMGLINVSGFVHAWRTQKYDGAISVISFVCTLVFAPHLAKGIMIGVALSLLVFLYKSMRPTVASLSRAEDQAFRCVNTHGLRECEYIAMVRFDGPLFYANASYLEDKMTEVMRAKKNLRHILLVSNGINDIDASGEETLSLLVDRIRSAGVDISLSGVNESVMKVLERTHFPEKFGEDRIFPTMEQAVRAIYGPTHTESVEEVCPLLTACRLTP